MAWGLYQPPNAAPPIVGITRDGSEYLVRGRRCATLDLAKKEGKDLLPPGMMEALFEGGPEPFPGPWVIPDLRVSYVVDEWTGNAHVHHKYILAPTEPGPTPIYKYEGETTTGP
jgi:hypothetical protein